MHKYANHSMAFLIVMGTATTIAAAEPRVERTEELIARHLYSKEELIANGGRHLVYKAWPKFAGTYIVASYGKQEGNSGEILPVEIAIVQYTGTVPTVIARNTFHYRVGFEVDRLQVDAVNYQLADSVTAFGLRTFSRYAGSGYESHHESLDLFIIRSKEISHVAGNLAVGDGGLFESDNEYSYCNNAQFCDPTWDRKIVETTLIVTPNKTREFFDLIAKTTRTEQSGRLDKSAKSARQRVQTERAVQVFRWDGEKYQRD